MMEVPQLHGFGPAANRLLEAYKMLLKVPNANILASHKGMFLSINNAVELNEAFKNFKFSGCHQL